LVGKGLATLLIVAGLVLLGLGGKGQNSGPSAGLAPIGRRPFTGRSAPV